LKTRQKKRQVWKKEVEVKVVLFVCLGTNKMMKRKRVVVNLSCWGWSVYGKKDAMKSEVCQILMMIVSLVRSRD
jgi:hypothetical protein